MTPVFRTAPLTKKSETADVVVHCSDPRYQPHFQDFLANGLALDSYALIAVPGGVHFLIEGDSAPRFAWVGWSWVEFMNGIAGAERVILIGHDDCRWYLQRRFAHDPARIRERICADLQRARAALLERFPHLRVESYYATLVGDSAEVKSI